MQTPLNLLRSAIGSLAIALLVALTPAQTFPGDAWEPIGDPETVGYSRGGLRILRKYVESLDITGMLVTVGGKVLFQHGNLEETGYVASVRKSVLAMLYGKYVAEGTIDLDRTVGDLGLTDGGTLLPIELNATVEDLITARSGIYHLASNSGDATASAPERGSQEPGTYQLYNNWDFNAAGAAFEKMTGTDIYDALEKDLARPIGMQDFDRSLQVKSGNSERSQYLAYHMRLSARDMARLGHLLLCEGRWGDQQIIPSDWVARITSAVTPLEEMHPTSWRKRAYGYGYMWWVWDGPDAQEELRGAYTADGAYGQWITVLPALDMVISIKTDVGAPGDWKGDFGERRTTPGHQYFVLLYRLLAAHRS